MSTSGLSIDHPAVGAAHAFVSGSADSLVAAAVLFARSPSIAWVMVAREHRLPVLLERPLAEAASSIWCMGYSGTGNPLLPSALEAHVTHRPLYWLSTTTGRLTAVASELPGVSYESMPGGSLVLLVQRHVVGEWTNEDRVYERIGHILGRFPGAKPSDGELALANRLHAAAVLVRNNEQQGAPLVRALASELPNRWGSLSALSDIALQGQRLIRESRLSLARHEPLRGELRGPALWLVEQGLLARGCHGKALAARSYARQEACGLIERVDSGFTKAWVVLPPHEQQRWPRVASCFARFGNDFSYTGSRGAGAMDSAVLDEFTMALWEALSETD